MMASVLATVAIHCKILDDNNEKPGSYRVSVAKLGTTVFEVQNWGRAEDWDNGSVHVISSGNLQGYNLPAKGEFALDVSLDAGENIDVSHEFWITVEDADNQTYESSRESEHWQSDVRSNTYLLSVN